MMYEGWQWNGVIWPVIMTYHFKPAMEMFTMMLSPHVWPSAQCNV